MFLDNYLYFANKWVRSLINGNNAYSTMLLDAGLKKQTHIHNIRRVLFVLPDRWPSTLGLLRHQEKKKTSKYPLYIFISPYFIKKQQPYIMWPLNMQLKQSSVPMQRRASTHKPCFPSVSQKKHLELSSSIGQLPLAVSSGQRRSHARVPGQEQEPLYGDGGVLRELHEPVWLPPPEPWY